MLETHLYLAASRDEGGVVLWRNTAIDGSERVLLLLFWCFFFRMGGFGFVAHRLSAGKVFTTSFPKLCSLLRVSISLYTSSQGYYAR